MPNWCHNHITITGPDPVLDELLAAGSQQASEQASKQPQEPASDFKSSDFKSSDPSFSLEALIPTPTTLLDGEGWYDWRIDHWGTKWDLSDVELVREPGQVWLHCLSPWGPPLPALLAISRRYPALKLHIHYEEPMMELAGRVSCKSGKEQHLA